MPWVEIRQLDFGYDDIALQKYENQCLQRKAKACFSELYNPTFLRTKKKKEKISLQRKPQLDSSQAKFHQNMTRAETQVIMWKLTNNSLHLDKPNRANTIPKGIHALKNFVDIFSEAVLKSVYYLLYNWYALRI